MDTNTIGILIAVIILIALSSFFSATETAFSSVNKVRLKNYISSGNKRAARALKMAQDYDKTLSAVLIGNNIVNIAAASLGTILFTKLMGDAGVGISTIVMTIVVLIFGEVLPKSMAKLHSETFALRVTNVMFVLIKVFYPLIFLLTGISKIFAKKTASEEAAPSVTEEELKVIIEEIEDEGVLEHHESELVQSALEFDDITVDEILTPRVDVVAVELNDSPDEIKQTFFDEGFSRLPVYDKTIDNVIGVLNQKDFIKAYLQNKSVNIRSFLQKVEFVPPKKHIAELLKELQMKKIHIAIVTDQYGGTLGIVTLEDIVEELVGEIWDESDTIKNEFVKLYDNTYRVSGDMNLYDFFDRLDIKTDGYDGQSQSLSGFALEQFEKIPEVYDSFDYQNLHITVESVVEKRITSFIVKVNPIEEKKEEE